MLLYTQIFVLRPVMPRLLAPISILPAMYSRLKKTENKRVQHLESPYSHPLRYWPDDAMSFYYRADGMRNFYRSITDHTEAVFPFLNKPRQQRSPQVRALLRHSQNYFAQFEAIPQTTAHRWGRYMLFTCPLGLLRGECDS